MALKFEPTSKNITWLVCDMVEKPAKVAALMTTWIVNEWCRSIFNLKLPMKKRYEEVAHILDKIRAELAERKALMLKFRLSHLYHDREEITVHIQNIWAAYRPDREF